MAKLKNRLSIKKIKNGMNEFLILAPTQPKKILVRFSDKKDKIQRTSYVFIDHETCRVGETCIWNKLINKTEKIKVSLSKDNMFRVSSPIHLEIKEAFFL